MTETRAQLEGLGDKFPRAHAGDDAPAAANESAAGQRPRSANQFPNVQYLRATAALIVVLWHAALETGRGAGTPLAIWHGGFGVEIFFVISGFIITYTSRALSGRAAAITFIHKRLARIVPLYWITTTAFIAISVLMRNLVHRSGDYDPIYIVNSYLFIPSQASDGSMQPVYGLGWSLNYEMFFYFCFAVAILKKWMLPVVIAALVSMTMLHSSLRPNSIPWALSGGFLLEFVAGVALGLLAARTTYRLPGYVFWLSTSSLLVLASIFIPHDDAYVLPTPASFALAVAIASVAVFSRKAFDPFGIFTILGFASFSLYLTHMFVVRALVVAFGHRVPAEGQIAIIVAASALAAVICWKFLEAPLTARVTRWLTYKRAGGLIPRRQES